MFALQIPQKFDTTFDMTTSITYFVKEITWTDYLAEHALIELTP